MTYMQDPLQLTALAAFVVKQLVSDASKKYMAWLVE
jgi:hypothetical protein